LLCSECEEEAEGLTKYGRHPFLKNGRVGIRNPRYRALLHECIGRIPNSGRSVHLRTEVRLRKRGTLPGVVGLTTFSVESYAPNGVAREESGVHTITFYTNLMDRLTDRAVVAVMAHELAHAWLNEHLRPEASKTREDDADMLAEMWGFGHELAALAEQTEPISS
jgi:hypothetical protein